MTKGKVEGRAGDPDKPEHTWQKGIQIPDWAVGHRVATTLHKHCCPCFISWRFNLSKLVRGAHKSTPLVLAIRDMLLAIALTAIWVPWQTLASTQDLYL